MIADASTAVFTIDAGGIKKIVSVYALGLEMEGVADGPARAAFKKLADRLSDFDQGGTIPTDVYEPAAYRGVLFERPGIEARRRPRLALARPHARRLQGRRRPERHPVPAPHDDPRGDRRSSTIDRLRGRLAGRRPDRRPTASPTRSASGRCSPTRPSRSSQSGSCHRVPGDRPATGPAAYAPTSANRSPGIAPRTASGAS